MRVKILFIAVVFLEACAQVVAPGGGKKDIIAPKTVKYIPDSAQTNFNSKSVQITFDEFIQLKDLNTQLIISPPLKNAPEISIKNKTVDIVFDKKDTLKQNTTYCISFGNAIQDITENNPTENFNYIFSTGSFIDSATVKGKVENGFNHTTEKGILVMLYGNYTDSIVYKSLPDYFGKTKEDGTFQINNVKEGKYKVVAVKDGNSNYKYDGESERIGFMDALINASEKKSILIDLFQEIPKKLYLKKATYDSYGKVVIVFNKSADSLSINPINSVFKNEDVLLDYSKNKDTLNYWFRNIDNDVLKLQLKDGSRVIDTLEYKLITKEDALKSKRHPLKLAVLNSFNGNENFDLGNPLKLVLNHPLETDSKLESFYLKQDTSNFKTKGYLSLQTVSPTILSVSEIVTDTLKGKKYVFDNHISPPNFVEVKSLSFSKENTKYHLFIPPGTLTDFFGLANDTIKMDFKTRDEKYYGTVKLKLTIPESKGKYIVQLLDDRENIIRESSITAGETINYEYLHPQQYKLKLMYDDNSNGKWDTGNYIQKTQPEKVIYYTGSINIRSNWDLDLEWKITNYE